MLSLRYCRCVKSQTGTHFIQLPKYDCREFLQGVGCKVYVTCKCLGAARGIPAPVAVLVDGEPVFQAYIAYCAICRGPCRGAPPPKVAYARPGKKKTKVAQGGGGTV